MFFEASDYEDDEDYSSYTLTIDLIKQKPGKVETVFGSLPAESDETYYGTIDYSLHYDGSDKTACKGGTVTKIVYTHYDYSEDEITHTEQTDPSYLSQPSVISTFCGLSTSAFESFDQVFKKYKLKSRMKNLGFSDL